MTAPDLQIHRFFASTGDGWLLQLKRIRANAFDSRLRPVLILPGYGMNTHAFSVHPRGESLEASLARAGFEVWSVDLRGQGGSRPRRASPGSPSLRAYALRDLPAALRAVVAETATGSERVDVVGASLGGSMAYACLALGRGGLIGSLAAVGAPMRWERVHPAVRIAFRSRRVAAALSLRGTRHMARVALPVLGRVPGLLGLYVNTALVDMSIASELSRTVEDTHPRVNFEMARWIRGRDLFIDGVCVREGLAGVRRPLMVVLANRDCIVPRRTALSAVSAWGGHDVEVLEVGDRKRWFAHANLFVADDAPRQVFGPIARWLKARNALAPG